jgi:DNA-binding transcriptional regulator YbjK
MPAVRDPEGRKRAILDAALVEIADQGIDAVSHRSIARRAGVPLGSTTYYFPTLDDLLGQAIEQESACYREQLADWAQQLSAGDPARELAVLVVGWGADPRARVESELYVAGMRDPRLQALALQWLDGLVELLAGYTDRAGAQAIAAYVDGVVIQALLRGTPLVAAELEPVLRRFLP